MRGRVANDLYALGILIGNDRQIDIAIDQIRGIDQLAIDLAGQRGAGQAGADAGSDFGNGDSLLVAADGTIRQFDIGHGKISGRKKSAGRAALF